MIREKSHCACLPLDSWFLESNGKKVQWDFSLIIELNSKVSLIALKRIL
jgi:hypothetical protein